MKQLELIITFIMVVLKQGDKDGVLDWIVG